MVLDTQCTAIGHDFMSHFRSQAHLQQLIGELRDTTLHLLQQSAQKFHPDDLHKVRQDDLFLRGFLHEYYDDGIAMDTIARKLLITIAWRCDYCVSDLRAEHFPKDLYEANIFR